MLLFFKDMPMKYFGSQKKMFVEPDEIKAYSLLERKGGKICNNNYICF